jgi:hypothetical protein
MALKRNMAKLSQRSLAILLQGKTDLITIEVVAKRYFADANMDAARSLIHRLCGTDEDDGYLHSEPLDHSRVYYRLTRRGTRVLGISPKYAVKLKKQGKVSRYAISWFIHADQPGKRALFNPHQFPDQFDLHHHRLPKHPFFIDHTAEKTKLGMILVDHNAHPRRTAQKTLRPLRRILRQGWFDEFIQAESFLLAVLTFSKYRKRVISQLVEATVLDQLWPQLSRLRPDLTDRLPLEIQVHVVPGLDILVTLARAKREEP